MGSVESFGSGFEAQPLCVQDFIVAKEAPEQKKPPCLIYSVGVYASLEWEGAAAERLGCEVHTFDPTVSWRPWSADRGYYAPGPGTESWAN